MILIHQTHSQPKGLEIRAANAFILTKSTLQLFQLQHCRISPLCFLAECRKRRLNQGSFVLLFCCVLPFCFFLVVFSLCILLSVFLMCLLSSVFQHEPTWMALCVYSLLCWCAIKNLLLHSLLQLHLPNLAGWLNMPRRILGVNLTLHFTLKCRPQNPSFDTPYITIQKRCKTELINLTHGLPHPTQGQGLQTPNFSNPQSLL